MRIKKMIETIISRIKNRGKMTCDAEAIVDISTVFEGKNKIGLGTETFHCYFGYGSYVAARSRLMFAKIGKYCSIGQEVHCIFGQHPAQDYLSTHPSFYSGKNKPMSYVKKDTFDDTRRKTDSEYSISIGNDVWIGDRVSIMEGVTIGNGAIIAAGAVVVKNVAPYEIVGGVPAKQIRMRFEKDAVSYLQELKWWDKPEDWLYRHAEFFVDIARLKDILAREEEDVTKQVN